MSSSPVIVTKHAPERRRKSVTTLCGCSCCCCCCCCLHTLGSIVGAAVAPTITRGASFPIAYYEDEETGEQIPLIKKPILSAVVVFWWVVAALTFLGIALGVLAEGGPTGLVITVVIIALVFPALQLASAAFTAVVFAIWPRYDKGYQLKQVGKMTVGVLLGAVFGVVAMIGIGMLLALAYR